MVAILWWLELQMLIVVVMVTIIVVMTMVMMIVGMTVVMMLVMHWFHLRYGIDAARAKVMVTKPILHTVDIVIIIIIKIIIIIIKITIIIIIIIIIIKPALHTVQSIVLSNQLT